MFQVRSIQNNLLGSLDNERHAISKKTQLEKKNLRQIYEYLSNAMRLQYQDQVSQLEKNLSHQGQQIEQFKVLVQKDILVIDSLIDQSNGCVKFTQFPKLKADLGAPSLKYKVPREIRYQRRKQTIKRIKCDFKKILRVRYKLINNEDIQQYQQCLDQNKNLLNHSNLVEEKSKRQKGYSLSIGFGQFLEQEGGAHETPVQQITQVNLNQDNFQKSLCCSEHLDAPTN